MTDDTSAAAPAPAAEANAPQVAMQAIYIKDVSFESPLGPLAAANAQAQPEIGLNLNTTGNQLAPDLHEVVLTVTVSAKAGENTFYLCEVKQAGLFVVRGLNAEQLRGVLASFCPNMLLPYARQTISDLIVKGGFPPFFVPPVNFDALLEQAIAQQAQEGSANDSGAALN
jgi:preprotein translocase subunit SecB